MYCIFRFWYVFEVISVVFRSGMFKKLKIKLKINIFYVLIFFLYFNMSILFFIYL